MTASQTAAAMRRLADKLETLASRYPKAIFKDAALGGEAALGAASLLCFVRDLVTGSPKEQYTRDELLVLLETLSRDAELFPCGIGVLMWNLDHGDEDAA